MKIKGYNIKNPQTVNQTTVKRILESNLHPLKTHKFKHSEYFKEVEIAQQQGSDYVLAYKIYDMNFNQYYYICSYLESELNIKPNNDITIFRSRKYITTQDTQETTTDTETPKEYKTTLKQDIIKKNTKKLQQQKNNTIQKTKLQKALKTGSNKEETPDQILFWHNQQPMQPDYSNFSAFPFQNISYQVP